MPLLIVFLVGSLLCVLNTQVPEALLWAPGTSSRMSLGLIYSVSVFAFSLFYLGALNSYINRSFKGGLKLLAISAAPAYLAWNIFQLLNRFQPDRISVTGVVAILVIFSVVSYWYAARVAARKQLIPEESAMAYWLFSSVTSFMVILSAPILAGVLASAASDFLRSSQSAIQ